MDGLDTDVTNNNTDTIDDLDSLLYQYFLKYIFLLRCNRRRPRSEPPKKKANMYDYREV